MPSHAILAGVLLLIGIALLWIAIQAADGDFDAKGPRLAPVIVTAAWVAVCAVYLVMQFLPAKIEDQDPVQGTEAESPSDSSEAAAAPGTEPGADADAGIAWLPPLLVVAGLVGFAIALEYAGFIISAAVFFVWTAWVLGSRKWIRDVIVAILLAAAIYFLFKYLLDLFQPAGVLPL